MIEYLVFILKEMMVWIGMVDPNETCTNVN